MTGSSTQGITPVLHPVFRASEANAGYAALLGVSPQTDSDYYVVTMPSGWIRTDEC
jgi:hypothetical protein